MDNAIKEIAERLRGLRDVLQLSQEEFAEKCEISLQDYQEAESGLADISVSSLQKISRKTNVSLDELMFGTEPRMAKYFVTRNGKGVSVERTKAYKYQSLSSGFKNRQVDSFLMTIDPNDNPMVFNQHVGQEFFWIIKGTMQMSIDDTEFVLNPGDSIYFDSKQRHGMKALNNEFVQLIAIII